MAVAPAVVSWSTAGQPGQAENGPARFTAGVFLPLLNLRVIDESLGTNIFKRANPKP